MKFVGQTAVNDICSIRLGRRSCLHGWPSCHGLMSATLARAVAIFLPPPPPPQKSANKVSVLLFSFFLHFYLFLLGRVPWLASRYWTMLVKQILNKWKNLKKKVFRPNKKWSLLQLTRPTVFWSADQTLFFDFASDTFRHRSVRGQLRGR